MTNHARTKEVKSVALADLKRQQAAWARGSHIEMERPDYTSKPEGNLFAPLSKECIADLGRGHGTELERRSEMTPPKFHALHSSSALVANVFDYWRHLDLSILTRGLNSPHELVRVEGEIDFEWQTYQRLVPILKDLSNGSHDAYFEYLSKRYMLAL